jgi:hypothetical protein
MEDSKVDLEREIEEERERERIMLKGELCSAPPLIGNPS